MDLVVIPRLKKIDSLGAQRTKQPMLLADFQRPPASERYSAAVRFHPSTQVFSKLGMAHGFSFTRKKKAPSRVAVSGWNSGLPFRPCVRCNAVRRRRAPCGERSRWPGESPVQPDSFCCIPSELPIPALCTETTSRKLNSVHPCPPNTS
jgi:hypothetical protein